jgi:hypothetical protein
MDRTRRRLTFEQRQQSFMLAMVKRLLVIMGKPVQGISSTTSPTSIWFWQPHSAQGITAQCHDRRRYLQMDHCMSQIIRG